MKFTDINTKSIQEVSNKELISLHRRTHMLHALAIQRSYPAKFISFLAKVHGIIEKEMKRRNFKHKTPLTT